MKIFVDTLGHVPRSRGAPWTLSRSSPGVAAAVVAGARTQLCLYLRYLQVQAVRTLYLIMKFTSKIISK